MTFGSKISKAAQTSFTNQSLRVLHLAGEAARRMGHNFVGTEQLLMGIFAEETNQAAVYLRECGVSFERLEQEVEKITGRGAGFVAVEIPHTPRAKRVFEMASSAAAGKSPVMPEHLFQSLLVLDDGVATRVLSKLADIKQAKEFINEKVAEFEGARQQTLDIYRKQNDPALRALKIELRSRFTIIETYLERISQELRLVNQALLPDLPMNNTDKLTQLNASLEAQLCDLKRELDP